MCETVESPMANTPGKFHVHLVNLAFATDVNMLKEAPPGPLPQLPPINLGKVCIPLYRVRYTYIYSPILLLLQVKQRLNEEIDRKKQSVSDVCVSAEGQRVFINLRKT